MKSVVWNSRNRGFTLIELLTVISIMGMLSSIVFSSVQSARLKAENSRQVMSMVQYRNAFEMYYDKYGRYPGVKPYNANGTKNAVFKITLGDLIFRSFAVVWPETNPGMHGYSLQAPPSPVTVRDTILSEIREFYANPTTYNLGPTAGGQATMPLSGPVFDFAQPCSYSQNGLGPISDVIFNENPPRCSNNVRLVWNFRGNVGCGGGAVKTIKGGYTVCSLDMYER